eukprot:TRINITY_DN103523_c0_g1_i1.p1 TRINITY_DN103523_c0_g1~~TRINITY_DN103523_c0_g1_i1.p1  ORF type:complete len:337 (-),score=28.53 TRINITY_DN103523_c0_g1_i1:103-1113(-)
MSGNNHDIQGRILTGFNTMVTQLTSLTQTVKQQSEHFAEFFKHPTTAQHSRPPQLHPELRDTQPSPDLDSSGSPRKIKLNVGGKLFITTSETLVREQDTFFTAMLNGPWKPDEDGEYFIDRSPQLFSLVLEYLRDGKMPPACSEGAQMDRERQNVAIRDEFEFYQLRPGFDMRFYPGQNLLPKLEGAEWKDSQWELHIQQKGARYIPLYFHDLDRPAHLPFNFEVHIMAQYCLPPDFVLSSTPKMEEGVHWATGKHGRCTGCRIQVCLDRQGHSCTVTGTPYPFEEVPATELKAVLASPSLFAWVGLTPAPPMTPTQQSRTTAFTVTVAELPGFKG